MSWPAARPAKKAADGAELFAALQLLDDGVMKSDYFSSPDGWDIDAMQADLVTLRGTAAPAMDACACSTNIESFESADQFGGARPGYVFKCGPSGVGYYLDNTPPPVSATMQELSEPAAEGPAFDAAGSPPARASGFARPAGSSTVTANLAKAIRDDLGPALERPLAVLRCHLGRKKVQKPLENRMYREQSLFRR